MTEARRDVQCRKCKVIAIPFCRRCGHFRQWASFALGMCKPCTEFQKFVSGSGSDSSTDWRSGRRPGIRFWTGRINEGDPVPVERDSRSKSESHPWVAAYAHDMRNVPTPAENRLAELLTRLLPRPGSVEQQFPFGLANRQFILDFYLPEVRLGIEVDGIHHANDDVQRRIDRDKEAVAKQMGIELKRLSNHDCNRFTERQLTDWLRASWKEAARRRGSASK